MTGDAFCDARFFGWRPHIGVVLYRVLLGGLRYHVRSGNRHAARTAFGAAVASSPLAHPAGLTLSAGSPATRRSTSTDFARWFPGQPFEHRTELLHRLLLEHGRISRSRALGPLLFFLLGISQNFPTLSYLTVRLPRFLPFYYLYICFSVFHLPTLR